MSEKLEGHYCATCTGLASITDLPHKATREQSHFCIGAEVAIM